MNVTLETLFMSQYFILYYFEGVSLALVLAKSIMSKCRIEKGNMNQQRGNCQKTKRTAEKHSLGELLEVEYGTGRSIYLEKFHLVGRIYERVAQTKR